MESVDSNTNTNTITMMSSGSLKGEIDGESALPKAPAKGHCLCSPTTHKGSFRCRFHRSQDPKSAWMKRSNSMPANTNTNASIASLSPRSTDST